MTEVVWYKRNPLFKSIYKAQKKWRQKMWDAIEGMHYRRNVQRSYEAARRNINVADADYDKYLKDQLEETLLKKKLVGERRFAVIPLIDMLRSKHDFTGADVLCVGARNTDEIKYFRQKGAKSVVGIDLFTDDPDLTIMDMHDLKFPDAQFDIVYSRHSFEHAYDKRKAAQEWIRVLKDGGIVIIEVPGKYKGGGDYNRFEENEDVVGAFRPYVGEFLWNEYSRKEENTDKMDIIRVMFHVNKKAG